ncbi:hypothetical protein OsI_06033 [Oryza sativa Indica Group]|uniref:Uncharacterized protein n=1 Tax=Oryza sativa subsp. indica TaxID=39946 RepID=A2X1F3_ORYSI|nr:hypothetical protein OsI_06033 [Oryza sativa Indica Group]
MASSAGGGWPPTSAHHQRLPHRANSSPTSCAAASPWPCDAAVTLAIRQGSGRGSRRRGGAGRWDGGGDGREEYEGRLAGAAERKRKYLPMAMLQAPATRPVSLASATVSSASPLVADRRTFWVARVGNQVEME